MTPAVATLNELLRHYLTASPRDQALGWGEEDGTTAWLTTAEVADRIRALSLALHKKGVQPGDRVALLSENRWEWMVSDFAILAAGAVNVPIHPGLSARQIGYILKHSGARMALASTAERLEGLMTARRQGAAVQDVICFETPEENDPVVTPLRHAIEEGRAWGESRPGLYRHTRDNVEPGDLASLIYTSGTTGDPKGVMLTHGNFASNVSSCSSVFRFRPDDYALSFLPLCHVFERTVDYCYYLAGASVIHVPDLAQLAPAFSRFRPTVFAAVPRVYEKMYARILDSVPPNRQRLFQWASRLALRMSERRQAGRRPGPLLALQHRLADRLVYRRIRARMGGRVRFCNSGGAPLAAELAAFLLGAGIRVLEGYGLTETSPVIATNRYDNPRPGTVGPAIPGVEIRIAADGEILTRGPHVMRGYWNAGDATRETINSDGWLATGDIGSLDADGFLSITDRKKEILVTAQGKNVAPQPLENALKRQPLIGQVAVVGDRRPYLVALVVPDFDMLRRLAARLGIGEQPLPEQLAHAGVLEAVEAQIQAATVAFAHHEQIRRFHLLDREFSPEQDELTPTLKLKRRVIGEHFAEVIDTLYSGHEAPAVIGS